MKRDHSERNQNEKTKENSNSKILRKFYKFLSNKSRPEVKVQNAKDNKSFNVNIIIARNWKINVICIQVEINI